MTSPRGEVFYFCFLLFETLNPRPYTLNPICMPSQQNITAVRDLSDKLSRAKLVILSDYSGLPVNLQRDLREKITQTGGQFLVAKNTLFKLAFQEKRKGLPRDVEDVLRGPTAFLFAFEDEIAPIKALIEFSKEHELPKSKLGIWLKPSERLLSEEEINELAELPTKDQLRSQLIGSLNTPISRLVHVLSGNYKKLVFVLKAIKEAKPAN